MVSGKGGRGGGIGENKMETSPEGGLASRRWRKWTLGVLGNASVVTPHLVEPYKSCACFVFVADTKALVQAVCLFPVYERAAIQRQASEH